MHIALRFLIKGGIAVDALMTLDEAHNIMRAWETGSIYHNGAKVLSGFNQIDGRAFKWCVKIEEIVAMSINLLDPKEKQGQGHYLSGRN